jgi:hypothetical protein
MFDITLFLEGICTYASKIKFLCINNNLFNIRFSYNNKKIFLKCSSKIITIPLDQFSNNLSKTKGLIFPYKIIYNSDDLSKLCSQFTDIDPKYSMFSFDKYLKLCSLNDIKILKSGLINFFTSMLNIGFIGSHKYNSISSISINFFIIKYNTIDLKLQRAIKNNLRLSYFGGRCEVFGNKRLNEKVLHFDFKGMYQECMKQKIPKGP